MNTLDELELTRARICEQMAEIDRKLSQMRRNTPGRGEMLAQKQLFLRQVREQNLRIAAVKNLPRQELPPSRVSDHALVRWLERGHGIDVDRLRAMILTEEVQAAIRSKQAYCADDRLVYVLKENTVVTVMPVACLEKKTHLTADGPTSEPPADKPG